MYSKYSKVICISDATENNIREYLSYDKSDNKFLAVYNGVDVNKFANAQPRTDYHTAKKVVTMVAAFRHQKDQDTLIRAMQHLPREEYELWLVGDGARRGELERLVAELGLNNQVKFWGIRGDVPSLLKSSDVVALSSHWEGFGLAAVEGMSVGKPFIASDVDGLNDVTRGAGLLFKQGDDKQLAELIQSLMSNSTYYNLVASQCLLRAKQYDISRMADGYMGVYKQLVGSLL
jgi:glycosyltransferase involved in cell wall biosynthesis